jgi:hypothetical protein
MVAILIAVPLFLLAPSGSPAPSTTGPPLDMLGRQVNLTPPQCPKETGNPVDTIVVNVSFVVQLVGWCTPHQGVGGMGTEPDGHSYPFQIGTSGFGTSPAPWVNWTSPDGTFGVRYNQNATVVLWALAPLVNS